MVKDEQYEVFIQNTNPNTVCAYDLHPDLRYDSGIIDVQILQNKLNTKSAIVRIGKDNKYNPKKDFIGTQMSDKSSFKVDLEEYQKARIIFTT